MRFINKSIFRRGFTRFAIPVLAVFGAVVTPQICLTHPPSDSDSTKKLPLLKFTHSMFRTMNWVNVHADLQADVPIELVGWWVDSFEELHDLPHESARLQALAYLMLRKSGHQLRDLFLKIERLPPSHEQDRYLRLVYSRMVSANPRQALTYIDRFPQEQHRDVISTLFYFWAKHNLEEALDSMESLAGYRRELATIGILATRTDLSSERLQEIADFSEGRSYLTLLESYQPPTEGDARPRATWIELKRVIERYPEDYRSLLKGSVYLFDKFDSNLPHVLVGMHFDEGSAILAMIAFVAQMAHMNPEGTVSLLQERLPQAQAEYLTATALHIWTRHDAVAAFESATRLDEMYDTDRYRGAVLEVWPQLDAYAVLDLASRLPESLLVPTVAMAIGQISQSNPQESALRVSKFADEKIRREASVALIHAWAKSDPQSAANWIMVQHESSPDDVLLRRALTKLAVESPHEAMNVASNYHYGFGRDLEMSVFGIVVRQDPATAIQLFPLVRKVNESRAAGNLAFYLYDANPNLAIEFGETLEDSLKSDYFRSIRRIERRRERDNSP